jgi:hypothetical protein
MWHLSVAAFLTRTLSLRCEASSQRLKILPLKDELLENFEVGCIEINYFNA